MSRRGPWLIRAAAALAVLALVGVAALLVWSMAFATMMEESCMTRAPAGAGDVRVLPEWVGPTTFRCMTWDGRPVAEFRQGDPLALTVFVVVPSAAVVLWTWYRLLIRPWRQR